MSARALARSGVREIAAAGSITELPFGAAGLHKSRCRALPRLYSGAVLREDTLHDCLEVPIRARAGKEVLAYEEGGNSVDAHVGRLLEIPHDRLFVVSRTETLPELGGIQAALARHVFDNGQVSQVPAVGPIRLVQGVVEREELALLLCVFGSLQRIHGVGDQGWAAHDEACLGCVGSERLCQLPGRLARPRLPDPALLWRVGSQQERLALDFDVVLGP